MGPTEIKVGGLGGQGVILGGIIIGKAAALFDGKHSCLTQAFGPAASEPRFVPLSCVPPK